ncbi:MAG: glycerophosphodiester phosphodiesterase [Proteobacteria bacterium]|nr:glycerophosphodiester phosphodiesterase [Pseudomonadota bacterium]
MKIGHRGACAYAPENTLASFAKALELGVDMIELDIFCCRSGELVVIHDESVDRTTNGKGLVVEMDYDTLCQFDAGGGEKIPLLSEVFDLAERRVKINIEIKGKSVAAPLVALIDKYVRGKGWSYDDFLVSSFDHSQLQDVRRINGQLRIGANIDSCDTNYGYLLEGQALYSIHPSIDMVDRLFVEDAHHKGLKVFVWTVVEAEDIERLKEFGVDGMFLNHPDRLE